MTDDFDTKRLRRVKVVCTICGTARHFSRDKIKPLWRSIDRFEKLPATWDMVCPDECSGVTTHFIDWPDPPKRRR